MRRFKRFLILLVGLVVSGAVVLWWVGSVMVSGQANAITVGPSPAVNVRLVTSDGLQIGGTYRPAQTKNAPAVLLLHGVGGSRMSMAGTANWLGELGYTTLAIDFRGHGTSTISDRTFGYREAREAGLALAWLRRRSPGAKVAILGVSLGGAASLVGEAGPLTPDALILQAVYPDIRHAIRNRLAARLTTWPAAALEPLLSYQAPLRFGIWPSALSPLRAIAQYDGPVLIIGGEQDRATLPDETRALYDAAAGSKRLWFAPEGDHPEISSLATPAYRAVVATFLANTIDNPSGSTPPR